MRLTADVIVVSCAEMLDKVGGRWGGKGEGGERKGGVQVGALCLWGFMYVCCWTFPFILSRSRDLQHVS